MQKKRLLISCLSLVALVLIIVWNGIPAKVGATGQNDSAAKLVDKGPEHHLLYQPGEIDWKEGPASLEPGAQIAVLEGSPGEPGVFTMRIKMPDGFTISPHWHPKTERVTVISGIFHLGSGEELDRDSTKSLKPGSYTSMPPGMRHFAIAEGETVIQLTSTGPWEINYVNPEDDPRNTAEK
ncbi:MAG TPA: cupin domain-containing protein [Thermodesulfobacteriota bacterium]|nr:cupin domain-containing protein [Thermodesulfobacteriota bacterium]